MRNPDCFVYAITFDANAACRMLRGVSWQEIRPASSNGMASMPRSFTTRWTIALTKMEPPVFIHVAVPDGRASKCVGDC